MNLILAVCSPVCSNGGTCSSPGTCNCQSGYSGTRCQTGKSCFNVEKREIKKLICKAPSCYSGEDLVELVDGGKRSIKHLKVGDEIWSIGFDGKSLIKDEIILMMHHQPTQLSKIDKDFFCLFIFELKF